jgi:hypothetical protein
MITEAPTPMLPEQPSKLTEQIEVMLKNKLEDQPDTYRVDDEDSIEKKIYEKVNDALERSPSP